MKFIAYCLLICLPPVLGACAASQMPVALPPPEPAVLEVAPPPAVDTTETAAPSPSDSAAAHATEALMVTADSIREKRLERAQQQKSLLQVIREAGVPDDNLTPGRKEQIAVYQRAGKYQFYHFLESRLIATGEYPRSVIEQMKQQGHYPRDVIRDFSQLLQ